MTLTGMPRPGPDVVVVDAGRHDVDEHFVVGDAGDVDDFLLEGLHRRAEPLRADQPGVHLFGESRPTVACSPRL
jgi:hypothetical protein